MAIKLYDTLSQKKKSLKTRSNKKIEIFVCGPTVYDYTHIGHARTYIAFDAFVKYLRLQGFKVRYVQNITDIEDKIIDRARKLKQSPVELAKNFETEYYHDMETLEIDSVDKYARATDYVPQILSQIQRLTDKGFAYEIPNEGIYFDISKFKNYGKLSHRTVEQAEDAVSRIDESSQKRNKGDFALWRLSSKQMEPSWPSPWGLGRPGWHIEDTAITEAEFGSQYDIHGGARDLLFPHHESEIAQMEAISGKKPLVNYWLHTGFLTIAGAKMSKSLGNFITIHEFLREHSRETLRLYALSSHYRSPIDYTEQAVEQAGANARRLKEFYAKCVKLAGEGRQAKKKSLTLARKKLNFEEFARLLKKFFAQLDDDFNTPKAFAILFNLIRRGNTAIARNKFSSQGAGAMLEFLNTIDKIFGIIPKVKARTIPREITELVDRREKLRLKGNWKEADEIRSKIEGMGYGIEDTNEGPRAKEKV